MAAYSRSTECVCVAPRASWREIFQEKAKTSYREEKNQKPVPQNGDILNEVRKGTFQKSIDIFQEDCLIRHPPPVKAH